MRKMTEILQEKEKKFKRKAITTVQGNNLKDGIDDSL